MAAENRIPNIQKQYPRRSVSSSKPILEALHKSKIQELTTPLDEVFVHTPSYLVFLLFYIIGKRQGDTKVVYVDDERVNYTKEMFEGAAKCIIKGYTYKAFTIFLDKTGYNDMPFAEWCAFHWKFLVKYLKTIDSPKSYVAQTTKNPQIFRQYVPINWSLQETYDAKKKDGSDFTIYKYKLNIRPIKDLVLRGVKMTAAKAVKEIRKEYPDFNLHTSLYSLGRSLMKSDNPDIVTESGYVVIPSDKVPLFAVRTSEVGSDILFIEGIPEMDILTENTRTSTILKNLYKDEIGVKFIDVRPETLLNWMLNPETQLGAARKYKTTKGRRASRKNSYYIEILIDPENPNRGSYRVDDQFGNTTHYVALGADVKN